MRNFEDEISGYLRNTHIARWLDEAPLKPGPEAVPGNMLICYELMISQGVFPAKELDWLGRGWKTLRSCRKGRASPNCSSRRCRVSAWFGLGFPSQWACKWLLPIVVEGVHPTEF